MFHYENEVFDGYIPGEPPTVVELNATSRFLINVGSVGQPRDGDPRAAYGIYDDEGRTITLYRVTYAVDAAQRRILSAGLPRNATGKILKTVLRQQPIP